MIDNCLQCGHCEACVQQSKAFAEEMNDGYSVPSCTICGSDMESVECWQCFGDGGWHDCGDDCCPCLDKEEITRDCDECNGQGWYWQCTALPHTDEQMAAWRAREVLGK